MDKRQFERFKVSIRALVLLPDTTSMEMRTINISDGGVCFDTQLPVPLGTEIMISFAASQSIIKFLKPQQLHKIKGKVCRIDKSGSAITFTDQQEFSRYIVTETSNKFRVLSPF